MGQPDAMAKTPHLPIAPSPHRPGAAAAGGSGSARCSRQTGPPRTAATPRRELGRRHRSLRVCGRSLPAGWPVEDMIAMPGGVGSFGSSHCLFAGAWQVGRSDRRLPVIAKSVNGTGHLLLSSYIDQVRPITFRRHRINSWLKIALASTRIWSK